MKTPWRFLAGLVSRKTPIEKADEADGNNSVRSLVYHPTEVEGADLQLNDHGTKGDLASPAVVQDQANFILPELMEAPSSPPDDFISSVHFPEGIVALDVSRRGADEAATAGTEPSGNKRPAKARRSHSVARLRRPPIAETTPADEMSDLDAEIRDLRKQLVKKLSLQNRYLRQMLSRYDKK